MCEVVVAEGEGIIMSAPNMATITASLEKCLQNCSLNKHQSSSRGNRVVDELGKTRSSRNSSTSYNNNDNLDLMLENHEDHYYYYNNIYSSSQQLQTDAHALDLNSQSSLPYHWEQCLDLKQSGEIYYINWRTGMKAKEDPRSRSHKEMIHHHHHNYYFEEEEEEEEGEGGDDDDDEEEEEDDGSSSSSSTTSSDVYSSPPEVAAAPEICSSRDGKDERSRQVLVVAGCKLCLMYFMVPKQLQLCPKCTAAQLLHF